MGFSGSSEESESRKTTISGREKGFCGSAAATAASEGSSMVEFGRRRGFGGGVRVLQGLMRRRRKKISIWGSNGQTSHTC